jgi:hypothetical protein
VQLHRKLNRIDDLLRTSRMLTWRDLSSDSDEAKQTERRWLLTPLGTCSSNTSGRYFQR